MISSYVTIVDTWRRRKRIISAEFSILQTEYPVIPAVIFPLQTSPFEFIIALGSVLGIWYGFSAIHLDPVQHYLPNSVSHSMDRTGEKKLNSISSKLSDISSNRTFGLMRLSNQECKQLLHTNHFHQSIVIEMGIKQVTLSKGRRERERDREMKPEHVYPTHEGATVNVTFSMRRRSNKIEILF